MALGDVNFSSVLANPLPKTADVKQYYQNVKLDFEELHNKYPFSMIELPPTKEPYEATVIVVAAEKSLIESLNATEEDFTKRYSKLLEVIIPHDYKKKGCKVFGGDWIASDSIPQQVVHWNSRLKDGRYELCIGVPDSFANLKNPLLESIRTADNLLVAYERYQTGNIDHVELNAYSHGEAGKREYEKSRKKYRTK